MSKDGLYFLRRALRKLRWLAGRGWSAADFAERYASEAADAWGYRNSPDHERRADFILAALAQPRFESALEVGCAEGFLTERLASRVDRLIACDVSAEAVRRARETCRAFTHVEFVVADIRRDFPGENFDLSLFSDVLYYLSPRETDAVLKETARRTRPDGVLLIANEWTGRAGGLTSPQYGFARLEASRSWARESLRKHPLGETELSIAIYRRAANLLETTRP